MEKLYLNFPVLVLFIVFLPIYSTNSKIIVKYITPNVHNSNTENVVDILSPNNNNNHNVV